MMINIIRFVSGFLQGFYRGYFSTILREIPFSVIQFPLWECFKVLIVKNRWNEDGGCCSPIQSALCGAVAGGFFLYYRREVVETIIV
jgi:solute carrier family 25 S-adenosylmethionine transporter 26